MEKLDAYLLCQNLFDNKKIKTLFFLLYYYYNWLTLGLHFREVFKV